MNNSFQSTHSLITTVTPFAEVQECPSSGRKSLHAKSGFVAGQLFSRFTAEKILCQPNYRSIQISDTQHIMLNPEWLQYTNHSCSPNIFFDIIQQEITVLQSIKRGEEIRYFYPSTEWSMEQAFDCLCGSEHCLGQIKGAAYLPVTVLKQYKLSAFIQQKLGQGNNSS